VSNPIPHPLGEPETALVPHAGLVAGDTFGSRVHVEWDSQAAVTDGLVGCRRARRPWPQRPSPSDSIPRSCARSADGRVTTSYAPIS
jgi:hypothetical protein